MNVGIILLSEGFEGNQETVENCCPEMLRTMCDLVPYILHCRIGKAVDESVGSGRP